jgi:flagellar hook-associated protein 3 FlgL
MTSRISTGQMFTQSLSTMLTRQSDLQKLQEQLATGKKIVTASDDPVAAGNAVTLDRALAKLEQFDQNGNVVQNRLNQQESALDQAGELLTRVKELSIQAASDTLSDTDRNAIAIELKALNEQLFSLANSQDGAGRYLFGGSNDTSAPFIRSSNAIVYNGDQTQKRVEIAPDMYVLDAKPGSEVFMRVRTGNGDIDASAAAGNTGSGIVSGFSRSASAAWDGGSYQVVFTSATEYEVRRSDASVVSNGTFVSGQSIDVAGINLTLKGAPADGDSFAVGPASARDVFSTIDDLITTLQTPATSTTEKAVQRNALQSALRDVSTASRHLIDARAEGGAQLANLDNGQALREANSVTLQTTLSGIRDLDYADAISRFQIESTALQAAQTVFNRLQGMSLFNAL